MIDRTLNERQKNIVSEIVKQCKNEKIAHEVIRQLEIHWGKPKPIPIQIENHYDKHGNLIGRSICDG